MFVNPTASWSGAFKLLGSQELKGITDNIKYYRGGNIIDKALKPGVAGSPFIVDHKKGLELLTDPGLWKMQTKEEKKSAEEMVKNYKKTVSGSKKTRL